MKDMRVSFYTLGCKVNQYETQMLRERFADAGYETVGEDDPADIYIINTCTVTNLSDRKSRQRIRRVKKKNDQAVIVVTGCYAQTDAEAVAKIPGVSVVAGTNEKTRIVEFVEDFLRSRRSETDGTQGRGARTEDIHVLSYEELTEYEEAGGITSMDSRTRAYIKIQEGCDRFCSYCIIPYARGKVRSRALKEVTEEARNLVAAGFKEIVLTGINTALYGQDWKEEDGLSGVEKAVAAISAIEGDFRIRLSSLEPNVVDEETARRLTAYPKLCPHMHLSLQSGSDTVLRRMNRRYDVETYRRIVDVFRQFDPEFAVTTDIIAGFPGETEEEFEESLETIRRIGFSKVHAFKYSMRDGTRAAQMPDQISGNVKSLRVERMMELAEREANRFFERNIGKVRQVLFERYDEKTSMLTGFTDNYIHTCCRMPREQAEKFVNGFSDVLLKEIREGGLEGEIV